MAARESAAGDGSDHVRAVFDEAPDAMVVLDDQGRKTDVNAAACELFGARRGDLLDSAITDYFDPAFDVLATFRDLLSCGRVRGQAAILRADGSRRHVDYHAAARIAAGKHLAILRDVTGRHEAEERLRQVVDRGPALLFALDPAGQITLHEGRAWQGSSAPNVSLVGRPIGDLFRTAVLRDEEGASLTTNNLLVRVLTGATVTVSALLGATVFEYRLVPWRGARQEVVGIIGAGIEVTRRYQAERELREATGLLQTIINAAPAAISAIDTEGIVRLWNPAAHAMFGWTPAEVVGHPLPFDDAEELSRSIRRGDSITGASVRRRTKAELELDVALSRAPLRDDGGQIIGAIEVLEDISQQRRLEDQLAQAQKMEAVGRLAGGIAHDLNNALAVIQGFAFLTRDALPDADPMRDDVDQVIRAVDRASTLTRQLLAFSRKQVFHLQIIEVNAVVTEVEKMLRRVIGEDVELRLRLAPDAGRIHADVSQMDQVLLNLAVNARDAMPRGGVLTIETAHVYLGADFVREHPDLEAGDYVLVAVSDTGTGMDRPTLERIFEPFFTTKPKGRGTGLGLSMVYGIIKQSGGHIAVDSRPGAGSRFKVYLPTTVAPETAVTAQMERPAVLNGTETILVVEDEEMVRHLAGHILRRNGYVVLEAVNAGEALLMVEQHPGEIHLALCDIVLPRVSGVELSHRLARVRPQIRVLFMSGYGEEATAPHGFSQTFELIEKPFTPQSLLTRVRKLLDGEA